jgi:hypothetical protein
MSAEDRPPEHEAEPPGTTQRTWRYDSGSAIPDPYPADFAAFESMLDTAWRELLFEHMAFGVVSTDEREAGVRAAARGCARGRRIGQHHDHRRTTDSAERLGSRARRL